MDGRHCRTQSEARLHVTENLPATRQGRSGPWKVSTQGCGRCQHCRESPPPEDIQLAKEQHTAPLPRHTKSSFRGFGGELALPAMATQLFRPGMFLDSFFLNSWPRARCWKLDSEPGDPNPRPTAMLGNLEFCRSYPSRPTQLKQALHNARGWLE